MQSQWVEAEAGHPRKYYELTQADATAPPDGRDLDAVFSGARLSD